MDRIAINGGKGTVALHTNGVIHLTWMPNVRIEAVDALAAVAAVNEVCDGTEHPMLVDMATTKTVTREARAVWSNPCAASRIALLGSSPVDRVVAKLCPWHPYTTVSHSFLHFEARGH